MAVYFIMNFGGVRIGKESDIVGLILGIVPDVILIYIFSNIMLEDCKINCVYVFTRMGKKNKWLFQKTIQLFFNIVFVFMAIFLSCFMVGEIAGFRMAEYHAFKVYLSLFVLNVLTLFVLILFQNVISLWFGRMQAFLFVILLYAFSLILAFTFYNASNIGNFCLSLLIPINKMYIWHSDCYQTHGAEWLLSNPLKNFHLLYSYSILVIYAFIIYLFARFFLLKADLAQIITED